MLQKGLRPKSLDNTMPALANAYMCAIKKIYGIKVTVTRSKWPRFSTFEDDLRELHIPIADYANTVCTILKGWCKLHNFKVVPINVFTGDWALSKFMKVWESDTVTIEAPSNVDELLHSELMVARLYIATSLIKYVRLSTIVDEVKDILSVDWRNMYSTKNMARSKFINMAIPILCEEFGIQVNDITSYSDIVSALS